MRLRHLTLAVLLSLPVAPVLGEPLHGRIQLQDVYAYESGQSLAAQLGARDRNDVLGDMRLSWQPSWNGWRFDFAYLVGFDAGDTPRYLERETELDLFPDAPPATWWDLSDRFVEGSHFVATQRIDRLAIGYTSAHLVLRAGRQALSWGAGLVFRPMDLFDPFAPNATDVEYKPGTDMLYGQYLFDDGSDLQFVAVPRPARRGGGVEANASSFAVHFRTAIRSYQTVWLFARDHGDIVTGLSVNGALGGATWNVELLPTAVRRGGTHVSALFNIADAGTLWDRDVTYFAEYFRNGFGIDTTRYAWNELPAPLIDRLLRGQVFNTGRDLLAAGALVQWTPLLQFRPTLIANLNDASVYAIVQADYSVEDNLNLIAGVQLPVGPARSEFGGMPLAPDVPSLLEPPSRLYLQIRRYF